MKPERKTAVECAQAEAADQAEFETTRRRGVLSFAHHAEVATLEPAEADAMLDRAKLEQTGLDDRRPGQWQSAGDVTGPVIERLRRKVVADE